MLRGTRQSRWFAVVVGLAFLSALVLLFRHREIDLTLSFDGDSTGLTRTQIVPTLDTPIEPGKNVIWCATLQAAWKDFQNNVVKAPLQIEGNPPESALLNSASDPIKDLPAGEFYVTSGKERTGATAATVIQNMKRLFPDEPMDDLRNAPPGYILFGFLKTRVPFTIPYFENDKPLAFTDSSGTIAPIRSFGIRPQDHVKLPSRHEQAEVLYALRRAPAGNGPMDIDEKLDEFAVDLCKDSRPNQIIVACIPRMTTLAETLDSLDKKIAANKEPIYSLNLLVPDMLWSITHHYRAIEGKSFVNAGIPNIPIGEALQEFRFRLDKSGADVYSKMKGVPPSKDTDFYFDKPFLVCIKQRDAARPFFVMWVDNDELLQRWPG